jgi:hypothetical protein
MVKQLIYTHMFYFAGKNVHMHDEKETDREREEMCVRTGSYRVGRKQALSRDLKASDKML